MSVNTRLRTVATSGEMFIKKLQDEPHSSTRKWLYSRSLVFDLWKDLPGKISVLTLPGLKWEFEGKLLQYRRQHRLVTHFTAVEQDDRLFKESQNYMRRAIGNNMVHFENSTVEALITRTNWKWTAAWLDYQGPMSTTKVACMKRLWPRLSHSMIVTFLGARFDGHTKALKDKAGGWPEMLAEVLKIPRSHVGFTTYTNGFSMKFWQLTAVKSGKLPDMSSCRYINGIKLEELVHGTGKGETP